MRKTSLALAVVTAICSIGAISAASAASGSLATVARVTTLRQGDAVIGALPMTHPIHIEVALNVRDRAGLDAFIAKGKSTMSPAQFLAKHAPTQVQAETVANYLTTMGYKNVVIAPNRLLISADGTAATARNAFMTSFAQVKTKDGRIAFANTSEVHVPAVLKNQVLSVMGLQNVHMMHTFAKVLPKGGVHTNAITGHNPVEFSSIYGGTGVPTAATANVGIITQGAITQSITDLNKFTSDNSLPTVTTQTINVGTPTSDTAGVIEWDLDSQSIVGMGGGQVAKIIFYNIPSLGGAELNAGFNKAVTDNQTKIINVSIGGCETDAQADGTAAASDVIFAAAAAHGQTFSISTGDSGADECSNGHTTPSWPANSPYVIAAAGTLLDASTTTWANETVWSGSGGSASLYEPKPVWQNGFVSGNFRGVADIAFDGDPNSGAVITTGSSHSQVGGTSLSAPIFAGLWARVIAAKGTGIGFAAPLIYALPAGDFHDITSGSNGIPAAVGYDLASGRGSIILNNAIGHLGVPVGNPPVANFSYVINGPTVTFTDTSTDSDGTITGHFWSFGDGTSSTATSPSHTYPGAGNYTVTETVTDNDFNNNTKTKSINVVPAGGANQLIFNTGFEEGTAPWATTTGVINNNAAEPAHAGTFKAWLDGTGKIRTDSVAQQVSIPSGKTSATLQYWLHIDSKEISKTRATDKLTVGVYSTGGNLISTLATYSNLNKAAGYQVHTADMTPYIGQTVVIKFIGKEDFALATSFVLDDVTLNVLP